MDNALFQSAAPATPPAGFRAAGDEVTYSGDTSLVQIVRLGHVSGTEGSKTFSEVVTNAVVSDTAYGLVTRHAPTGAPWHIVTANNTNAQTIKGSAGAIRSVHVFSNGSSPIYVKFHNTATTPTAGVSIAWAVACQAGQRADVQFAGGVRFSTGISMTIVKGLANSDATAPATSEADVLVVYE